MILRSAIVKEVQDPTAQNVGIAEALDGGLRPKIWLGSTHPYFTC